MIVAGNWKMNVHFSEAEDLIVEIADNLEDKSAKVEVIVCPPYLYIEMATDIEQESNIFIGAQNMSQFEDGAYTGEISAAMLQSLGVRFCIIGHSERRKYFHENDEVLFEKLKLASKYDIMPIFCIGELLEERNQGKQFEVVKSQLENTAFKLSKDDFEKITFAYEPVWAIGTGVTATKEQAQEMHAFIRKLIDEKYGSSIADECFILYGGSCNSSNAYELFSQPDVDGGLIGGASLNAEEFLNIVEIAEAITANA